MMTQAFTASPQQRRFWREPGQGVRLDVALDGAVDEACLARTLRALVDRHEALRAGLRLPELQQTPVLTPLEGEALDWAVVDDMVDDIETRAGLTARFAPAAGLLRLWVDGAFCDVTSFVVIVRDLAAIYANDGAELDEEPVDYSRYTEWLSSLEEEGDDEARVVWVDQIQAMAQPLRLAEDSGGEGGVDRVRLALSESARARIGVMGEPEHVLLAAWAALLGRLSGDRRLTLAVAFACRSFEELEDSVGLFTRYLPWNLELNGDATFAALIDALGEHAETLADAQDAFELLQQDTPLAGHVAFEWEPAAGRHQGGDVGFSLHDRRHQTALWPLKLNVLAGESLELCFDAARFERDEAERLLARLLVLLEALEPELTLDAAPVVAAADVAAWASFNDASPVDVGPLFHQQVARFGETTPDVPAVAFVSADGQATRLDFQTLNGRANRLANYLIQHGARSEQPVALLFQRSADMVVALLAVLKSGAPYLPLDPFVPTARLQRILDTANVDLVLTHDAVTGHDLRASLVDVNQDFSDDDRDPDVSVSPHNLAYVVFTSGSTGAPKGVAVTHANLQAYVAGVRARLGLDAHRHFALVSTLAADLGVTVLHVALAAGGCVHVLDQGRIGNPEAFAAYTQAEGVDVLKLTPSHLTALMSGERPEAVLPAKALVLGGEATDAALLARITSASPELALFNHYGPSETTVGVLTHDHRDGGFPVGRPLPAVMAYVVNRRGLLQAEGGAGEILLGGPQVVRGYLGAPALTAARFIPDGFGTGEGARLYRTGDLGRLLDGRLHFQGRIDHQLKIRGYRVELGEIETLLRACEGVAEAVVTPWEEHRLAAYVVSAAKQPPTDEQLRDHLSAQLPEYMIPSAFIHLDKLPLNANGKVDRKALPAPSQLLQAEYVAPRDEDETKLAELWADLLKQERVGVHDNFFDLGGHSLLIFQLIGKLQREFNVALTVRDVFKAPTVAELNARIQEGAAEGVLVTMNESGEGTPWFIIHPIGGQVHWFRHLAESFKDEAPVYALQSPGLTQPEKLSDDIGQIAETYIEAIRDIRPEGPYHIAGWSAGGSIALEIAKRLDAARQPVDKLVLIDARNHPDLEDDELEINTLLDFVAELTGRGAGGFSDWAKQIKDMPSAERLGFIARKLTEAGQIPAGIDTTYFERKFAVYRAHARAVNGYQPGPYSGHTTLVRARDTVRRLMTAGKMNRYDASLGWRKHGLSNFRAFDIEGNHQTIFTPQHVDALKAVMALDDPTTHEKVTRALVGRIWLDQATGKSKIDRILSSIIGIFESNFHDRICGYYLTGSFAADKATEASDIDLFILFRGHMTAEEYQRAHQTGQNVAMLSAVPLDLKYHDESEIKRLGLIDMRHVRKVYGEGLSFRPEPPKLSVIVRHLMHMNALGMQRLRKNPAYLRYPIDYPNADQPFFGYTVVKKQGEEGARGQTKGMVNTALKLAGALLAVEHRVWTFQKRDLIDLYADKIGGPFAEFLADLVKKCRDEWAYNVPKAPWAKKKLDALCKQMLAFENHFLESYRRFMLQDLKRPQDDGVWLSEKELRDFLSIPVHRLEEELNAGRLHAEVREGERLFHVPHLYRLLAISALARFPFLDGETDAALRDLADEDAVFQTKLLEATFRQRDKAEIKG